MCGKNFQRRMMELAYEEALKAYKKNEIPVGAIIELNGEVISKGQKIVTYHSPYWKELHHRNLCFDGSENDIILTSEDIPNHEDHVNRFVTALEVVKEDWSTELLAEIASQDITMGKPSVELRALWIMNDRRDTTANPALVDILLTQLERGAIRDRVKLEASNLLLMEKLKTHKEENEEE